MGEFGLQDIDIGGFNIRNIKDGSHPQDAVTFSQLKDKTDEDTYAVTFLTPLAGTRYPIFTCDKPIKLLTVEAAIKYTDTSQSCTFKTQSTVDLNSGYTDRQVSTSVTTSTILNTPLGAVLAEGDVVFAYLTAVTSSVESFHLTYTYTYDVVQPAKVRGSTSITGLINASASKSSPVMRVSAAYGISDLTTVLAHKDYIVLSSSAGVVGSIKANKEHRGVLTAAYGLTNNLVADKFKNTLSATYGVTASIKADPYARMRSTVLTYSTIRAETVSSGDLHATYGVSGSIRGSNEKYFVEAVYGISDLTLIRANVDRVGKARGKASICASIAANVDLAPP